MRTACFFLRAVARIRFWRKLKFFFGKERGRRGGRILGRKIWELANLNFFNVNTLTRKHCCLYHLQLTVNHGTISASRIDKHTIFVTTVYRGENNY